MITDTMRTFGIEIEFISELNQSATNTCLNMRIQELGSSLRVHTASWNDQDATKWRIKTDSSVSGQGWGLEIVSPVLTGENGYEQLETILVALNSMPQCPVSANRSCGLHVHVGVSDWKIANFKNLVKRYTKFESTIDTLMPNSRRGNEGNYCRSNVTQVSDNGLFDSVTKRINGAKTTRELSGLFCGRYVKLNLESFWKHGTVEFRHHSGTTETAKITNWLKVCMAMTMAADAKRSVKVDESADIGFYKDRLNSLMNGLRKVAPTLITNDVALFYRRRRRALCS